MITSDSAEFFCPLPENKAKEFFGVSRVKNSTLAIAQRFAQSVGTAASKVKSSEDLANLKDMIHRICDRKESYRSGYLSDLKLSNDSQKSKLPEIMAVLITKAKDPLELISEEAQEIQKEMRSLSGYKGENEKIILKNFAVRLTLNWLERIREKQQEISQSEDLAGSFNFMSIEESVATPSSSVKRVRFGEEDVSQLVNKGAEVESQTKSRRGGH